MCSLAHILAHSAMIQNFKGEIPIEVDLEFRECSVILSISLNGNFNPSAYWVSKLCQKALILDSANGLPFDLQ